jgi:hypothetical protein
MTDTENWQDTENAAPDADEWQEIDAEAKIILEEEGDGWQGRFMGMDPRNENGIIQAHFTNVIYLSGEELAPAAFINATHDLEQKLKKVPVKSMVRAQWVSSLDTGHESGTKMRVFRVQWK